jgi:tripartite-type tricarboxylate transporter receptor subunit TctC
MHLFRRLAVIAASLLAAGSNVASAEDWPAHTVTLVVPWAAGGGTDVMARIIVPTMSKALGQQIIVENISGAGGMVGASHVARATPDGYTFVFGSRSDAINMTLYKHPTFSLKDDLDPVVLVADQPTVLVTRKDFPVDSLKDFIAYVKRNASTVKMGSAGVGSTGSIDCSLFDEKIGVDIQGIPYRGSGPAMQDLIASQFDYFCTISGTAAAPLQNGLVKGIAVFRPQRLPSLPDVPTDFEQGMNFDASTWFAFFVPKGTPPAIVKKLHDAAVTAMGTPEVQEQLAANGTYVVAPDHRSTEYLQSIVVPEIEKNGAPLRAAGMSVD